MTQSPRDEDHGEVAQEYGDPETVVEASGAADDAEVEAAADAVETDIAELAAQRDEYLGLARRVQADFENFRKRTMRQGTEERERGAAGVIERLLPVLDACDGALTHGHEDVKPIYEILMDVLEKEGLALVYPVGEEFDPTLHEAVMHEPGDGPPIVVEVLRSGYMWKGRVLRAAMVKVRG